MFDGHDEPRLYAITEHLGRLKHDLGKYICFRQRWLDADADHDAWIEALRADLLATRSGPSGSMRVDQVWEEFRPWLEGAGLDVRSDPDGAELFAAMARVLGALPGLERGEVDGFVAATTAGYARSTGRRPDVYPVSAVGGAGPLLFD